MKLFNKPEDILEALKERTLSVAKLSRETGIPDSRMYKWRDRGSKITAEDSQKLQEWIAKMDKSPNGRAGGNNSTQSERQTLLNTLVTLVEKHGVLVDTNAVLSRATEMLVTQFSSDESGEVSQPLQEKEIVRRDPTESLGKLKSGSGKSLSRKRDSVVDKRK